MKIYEFKTSYGKKYHIGLLKSTYANNDTLYIEMVETTPKGKIKDYFDTLTVNLEFSFATKDKQYIDTNNLGEEILNWLKDNGIAKPTGEYGFSGYCTYPLFKFDKKVLAEMEELKDR